MSTKSLLIAGAALACLLPALPASAADLYNPPPETDYEPPPAAAWAPSPWYVALRGGAVFADDTSFGVLGTDVTTSYDTGPFVAGAVGYQFHNTGLRAEAELGYLESSVDAHDVGGVAFANDDATGDTSAFFGLASVYYDLPFNSPIRPFVGGGIGAADVSFENHGTSGTGTVLDDANTAFAWHLTAGVNYDISPNMALEVGYRYMEFDGIDVSATDGTESTIDASNNIVFAGLKYRF